MPILASDLRLMLSAPAASSGGSLAGSPGQSLGGWVSNNALVDNTTDNLFPDITGDENAASNVDYQCLFLYNAHSTLTLIAPVLWIQSEISGGANTALAVDNTASSVYGATLVQATTVGNKNTLPVGVSAFSNPTTKATGLALGDLGPGKVKAIWVRRTATNSAALNSDGVTLRFEGDTTA
jgi:hypothetical protein